MRKRPRPPSPSPELDEQRPEEPSSSAEPKTSIVGIGASAGGLNALKTFFGSLPQRTGLAFVVVVHLSPDHESHLADLLQPHCPMPVRQVSETMLLEPDQVYVIPPGANLNTIDSHLRLSELEEQRRERAPIDHFLRTLADTHDGSSVAVILTGTGSDGTLGLRRIKEKGGLTIAQDPADAEYDGMPRSAIASGEVDIILPLKEIPRHLLEIARTRPRVPIPEEREQTPADDERTLQKIFAQVRSRTGHDFNEYKRSTIMRRIRRRMLLHRLNELPEYLELLRESREEVLHLFEDLLITVTEFFRDPGVYQMLEKQIIPRLFEGKGPQDRLRVWSVGCSTGEEAYSLAMLLLEESARRELHPQIQVFASDLHENSLRKARDGIYPDSIGTDVTAERLDRFFVKDNGSYRVRKDVRELVIFAPHNLIKDPPFSNLDLIVCRNVLIYLQRDVQKDIMALFHYALKPDGLLLLGSAEAADDTELFIPEDKGRCLYRRRSVPARGSRLSGFPLPSRRILAQGGGEVKDLPPRPASYGQVHAKIVEQYAPPSILVSQSHDIVHYSARAGQYLQQPGGEPTNNVFRLVREPLQLELRSTLMAASETGRIIRSKPVQLTTDGQPRRVVVRVCPASDVDLQGFMLVIFDELEQAAVGDEAQPLDNGGASNDELHAELDISHQRLQSLIQEYETSQEEMQASNEELQSANEELRSTLEELETSKEELQSMNEELATVNQENRHRVKELSQLSADLQNLLAATDIATLFLDNDLRIVRFTPQVGELFNIRASDRGRPLSDLTHRLGDNELQDDARKVLHRLVPVERELLSEHGRWYLTRVLPYRTTDNRIEGVVITLIDITQRKEAEEAVRAGEERLRRAMDIDSVGVLFFNRAGTLVDANRAFLEITGYTAEDLQAGQLTWRRMTPPEWIEASEQQLAKLKTTGRLGPYEKEYLRADGSRLWMLFVGQSLDDGTLVEYCFDVSDRKHAEVALQAAKEEAEAANQIKDQFMAALSHELRTPLSPVLLAVSDLEQQAQLPAQSMETLKVIRRNVEIEARLIDDLLDVSRVLNGKLTMHLEPTSLHEAVRHAMQICEHNARERRIQIVDNFKAKRDTVVGDAARLQQIFWNLLSNAIKFSPDGQQVKVESVLTEGSRITVTVRDYGKGIPPDALERIFLPFEQLTSESTDRPGGLGLGLAICRGIVDAHGGTLAARSGGPGRGSEFSVSFPLSEQRPIPFAARAIDVPAKKINGDRRRLLVVDDHRDTADALAKLLKARGFSVHVAHTATQALELVDAHPIDVIISDIGLPDLSGLELMRQIRQRRAIAGIALSGYGREEDVRKSHDAGFSEHLVKPVDLAKLTQALRSLSVAQG